MTELTHVDAQGRPTMVDVSAKAETVRIATARGRVLMRPETLRRIKFGGVQKGDVLATVEDARYQHALSNAKAAHDGAVAQKARADATLSDLSTLSIEELANVPVTSVSRRPQPLRPGRPVARAAPRQHGTFCHRDDVDGWRERRSGR